jgi:phospholipid/cholesterol/gamma-HCH transport system substrate-binding protein
LKDNRTNYVIVGVFVLLMVAALIGSLAVLMGRTGPTATFYTVFGNVGGLKPGTQVMFEGYPIGQVARIEPLRDDQRMRFRLHLDVQRDWPVPEGSEARIAASGLLAAVTIDIRAGYSPTLLPPGSEIRGRDAGSVFTIMDEVAGDVREITRETIRPLLEEVSGYVTRIGSALETDGLRILTDARAAVDAIAGHTPRISGNLSAMAEKLNERLVSDENLDSVRDTLVNVKASSESVRAMTRDLQVAGRRIDALLRTLDAIAENSGEDVRVAMQDLRYSLEIVARHVDAITHSLDGTSRNMLEFSRSLRQNPGLLLRSPPVRDEALQR